MENNKEMVNHPKHYNRGSIEAIEVIENWNLGFSVGSAVKYISRLGAKDDEIQELEKAKWYLNRVMETNIGVMVGEADRKYEPYKVSKDWKLNDTLTKALGAIYWGQFILAIKYIDEEMAEIFLLKMGALIENEGYDACLQKAIPNLKVKGDKTTNPEVVDTYELIYADAVEEGKPVPDVIIDFGKAAKACGLGEMGLSGKIINN